MVDLAVEKLTVTYNGSDQASLYNITFTANRKELIIFAGPSGCGKSTLAKSILTLIPKYYSGTLTGQILLNGSNILSLPRKEIIKTIGFVPQYPADFTTSLVVEEEVAFPLENLLSSKEEIKQRLDEIFSQLNIQNLRKKLLTEISSGELQKVALAAAIAPKPTILVLDEPMARLDPKSEVELAETLYNIAMQGTLVLVFEHRLDTLLSKASRLIVIEEGKILADGKPRKLIDKLIGVDLPEVALIEIEGRKYQFLDILDAVEYIRTSRTFKTPSTKGEE